MVQDYAFLRAIPGALLALAVIIAVLAGLELDGVAGMFIAVPVVAVGSVVYRHWNEWRTGDIVDEAVLRVAGAKE